MVLNILPTHFEQEWEKYFCFVKMQDISYIIPVF